MGHYAVADLLLVRGIQAAVTTNVDGLIETAGQHLFGQIGAGIDGIAMAALRPNVSPLLKIHGCRLIDPPNMVWAPGQLNVEPVASRINSSQAWLNVQLLDRDLVIVGYWSDWDYLNDVLERTLGSVNPSRVLVVNPASSETFVEKAPELSALGERASLSFQHVRALANDFLDALRLKFSQTFVRRVLNAGVDEFRAQTDHMPPPALTEPPDSSNDALWRMRRDFEGCKPTEPAQLRDPPDDPLLGLMLLRLRSRGATVDGSYWNLNGVRIRVLRTPNKPLHRVQANFERDTPPSASFDVVIAVGAESTSLASNIARPRSRATIARGDSCKWMTRSQAEQEYMQ